MSYRQNKWLLALILSVFAAPAAADIITERSSLGLTPIRPVIVTDDLLESFIDAQDDINKIREDYAEARMEAGNQTEINDAVEEMNEDILEAIQDNGLTIQQYNEIETALQTDAALNTRYMQYK